MANNDVSVEDEQHLLLRIEQFVEDLGNSESRQQGLDEYDKLIKYLQLREHQAELRGRIEELDTMMKDDYRGPSGRFIGLDRYYIERQKEIGTIPIGKSRRLTTLSTNDTATDGENNI